MKPISKDNERNKNENRFRRAMTTNDSYDTGMLGDYLVHRNIKIKRKI